MGTLFPPEHWHDYLRPIRSGVGASLYLYTSIDSNFCATPRCTALPLALCLQDVYRKLGITADAVAAKGSAMLAYFKTHPVPPVPVNGPVL